MFGWAITAEDQKRYDRRWTILSQLDLPSEAAGLPTGYAQTKWVSEHLLRAARERGCPVTIYRLGLVTGDERTGKSNPKQLLWRSVKVMLDLEKATVSNKPIYLTPVDFAARAMVG